MVKRLKIALILVIFLTGGLLVAINYFSPKVIDYPAGHPGSEVVVVIPPGASGADVAHILVRNKVVMTWQAFFNRATSDSRSVGIQPGSHRLQTHLSAKVALEQLLDRKRMVGLVTITEGMRAANILELLEKSGWSAAEVKSAYAKVKAPTGYNSPSVEGYLFPASYSFASGMSASQVLQEMVDRFQVEAISIDLENAAKAQGLTPAQVVTIASLAQGEGDPGDFAKIVRVIFNRLNDGMKLQLDSTVLYALKVSGRIMVTNVDLDVQSKYNTYRNAGLPPGPIGNPGRAALLAALNPASGPWLFFITVKPGDTRFTDSESEFYKWKIEYQRNYAAGAFNEAGSNP